MKIIVHVPNWIGDSILALPTLESLSLNFPEDQVWVAAKDWVKDLFFACDFVEGTIALSSKGNLKSLRHSVRALKTSGFDLGSSPSELIFFGPSLLPCQNSPTVGIQEGWPWIFANERSCFTKKRSSPRSILP